MELHSALSTLPHKPAFSHGISNLDSDLLHEIAIRIFSPVPLAEVLGAVVDFIYSAVKCDSCLIYLLEDDALILRASKNPHRSAVKYLKLKQGQSITDWVATNEEPVAIEQNASEHPICALFSKLTDDRFESFLSVPILSDGRAVGFINLLNRSAHHYNSRELQIASTTALLVGADVKIALLESKNAELSDRLETRKLVERAKGILQRDLSIDESSAYVALQRESCRTRKPMRELAEAIVLNEDLKRNLKT